MSLKRQAAYELIKLLSSLPLQGEKVKTEFLKVVNAQHSRENIDFSDINAFLLVGKALISQFEGQHTRREVANAFMPLAQKFDDNEIRRAITIRIFDLQQDVNPAIKPLARLSPTSQAMRRRIILFWHSDITEAQLVQSIKASGDHINLTNLREHLKGLATQGIHLPLKPDVK